jgi:hypothetical protein
MKPSTICLLLVPVMSPRSSLGLTHREAEVALLVLRGAST